MVVQSEHLISTLQLFIIKLLLLNIVLIGSSSVNLISTVRHTPDVAAAVVPVVVTSAAVMHEHFDLSNV